MRRGKSIPTVKDSAKIRDALNEMTERDNLGVALVVGKDRKLVGIITDGDLRRMLLKTPASDPLEQPIKKLMSRNPQSIEPDAGAADALRLMEVKGITSLAIVDPKGRPAGIILLHDILGRGQFSA